jgi:hypothetical protein
LSGNDKYGRNFMTAQRRTPMTDAIHSLSSASVVIFEQPAETLKEDYLTRG